MTSRMAGLVGSVTQSIPRRHGCETMRNAPETKGAGATYRASSPATRAAHASPSAMAFTTRLAPMRASPAT